MYGKNGSTKVEMFSPLFILLAVIAVILVAVLAIAVQGGASLQARPIPVSTSTMEPVTDSCMCLCARPSNTLLCPVKPPNEEMQCSDIYYEYTDITDENKCSQKEGTMCLGYDYFANKWKKVEGRLTGCEITAVAETPTPTPTSTASY